MVNIWIACFVCLLLQPGCEVEGQASGPPKSRPSSTGPAEETNLIAMGDWGEDTTAERDVAAAMSKYVLGGPTPLTSVLLLRGQLLLQALRARTIRIGNHSSSKCTT